jgi:O-antigen/teichoic acid export membrane protein
LKRYFSSYWIRSAFYTILQRFSLTFFGLINFIILVRVLTTAEMGTWALFLTVTSVFEVTKSGLLKNAHIKYVSAAMICRKEYL